MSGGKRSVQDKLSRLVSLDRGVELQDLVFRLLRERDLTGGEVRDVLGKALRAAATRGSSRSMAALLNIHSNQHGVLDVDQQDEFGYTAVMLSVVHGHGEVTEQLVDCAVDLLRRSNAGHSVLDMAARQGNVGVVRLIMHRIRGYVCDEAEMMCYTALTAAAEKGQTEAVRALLQYGVDPNLNLDPYIGSALHCCVESGDVGCCELLLRHGADIEQLRACVQQTPLMRACEYGHAGIVRRLVEEGADVHAQTQHCSNALTVACYCGHQACVEILLEHGADPHTRNPWGFTPLYLSADSPGILERLLAAGVDVNAQCGERAEAALHLAAVIGFPQVCEMLLGAGADVDSVTTYNESPLWLAIWKGHEEVARLFIQENCKLNTPSNGCQVYLWCYTPMELALGSGKLEVANMLYEAGCPLFNPIYFCLEDPPPVISPSPSTAPNSPAPLPPVKLREEVVQYVERDATMLHWLRAVTSRPRTLRQLARIRLREALGAGPRGKIERLPLPAALRAYVAML